MVLLLPMSLTLLLLVPKDKKVVSATAFAVVAVADVAEM